ncbi:MAG: hypothetical protein KBG30_09760 [Bacteroidales bacterium]|nr:hypothetical protein [Bacteroidales bacterium]
MLVANSQKHLAYEKNTYNVITRDNYSAFCICSELSDYIEILKNGFVERKE